MFQINFNLLQLASSACGGCKMSPRTITLCSYVLFQVLCDHKLYFIYIYKTLEVEIGVASFLLLMNSLTKPMLIFFVIRRCRLSSDQFSIFMQPPPPKKYNNKTKTHKKPNNNKNIKNNRYTKKNIHVYKQKNVAVVLSK